MVSLDYNPLRRSTSIRNEAEKSGFLAEQMEITRQQAVLSLDLQENEEYKQKLQRRQQIDNNNMSVILGAIKIVGAAALTIATGGAASPFLIGAIAAGVSGGLDIAQGVSGTDMGGAQSVVDVGAGVAQQIYSYQSTQALKNVDQPVKDAINAQIAAGSVTWYVNKEGRVAFAPDTNTKEVLSQLDKDYGGSPYFDGSKTPATDRFNEWVSANGASGAQQIASRLVEGQTQLVNDSIQQFKQDGNFQNVLSTIEGLGMTQAQTADARAQAAAAAQFYKSEKEAEELFVTKGRQAAEEYVDRGGDQTIYREAYGQAAGNDKEYYRGLGYSEKDAEGLYQATRTSRINAKMSAMKEDMADAAKRAQAEREVDLEDSRARTGLNETQKESIKSKLATFDKNRAADAVTLAQAAFTDTLENPAGTIGVAAAAAKGIISPDEKSELVKNSVKDTVDALQTEALTNRFDIEYQAGVLTGVQIETLKRYYKKNGEYSGDFEGQEALRAKFYAKILDVEEDRKKKMDDAVTQAQKAAVALANDTANWWFNSWKTQTGEQKDRDGTLLLQHLVDNQDYLTADSFQKMTKALLFGKDENPDTAEVFGKLEKIVEAGVKNGSISNERQLEIYDSVRQTRLRGATPQELIKSVEAIQRVENAGFLAEAYKRLGEGTNNVVSKDAVKAFVNAAPDLDQYFYEQMTIKDGQVVTTDAAIGGDKMSRLVQAVASTGIEMLRKRGITATKWAQGRDENGDPEGYVVYMDENNRQYRLAPSSVFEVPMLETLEGGKWVEFTEQGKQKPARAPVQNPKGSNPKGKN